MIHSVLTENFQVVVVDHLFGIVVSSLTAIQEVPGSIPGCTQEIQPREDNWVAT